MELELHLSFPRNALLRYIRACATLRRLFPSYQSTLSCPYVPATVLDIKIVVPPHYEGSEYEDYFVCKVDVIDKVSLSSYQKCTTAVQMLAYEC
jgi:hypothetical protein